MMTCAVKIPQNTSGNPWPRMILVLLDALERGRNRCRPLQKLEISLRIKSSEILHSLLDNFTEEVSLKVEESGLSDCLSRIIRGDRATQVSFTFVPPKEPGLEEEIVRLAERFRALLPGADKQGKGVIVAP